jgi:hypothetical protein
VRLTELLRQLEDVTVEDWFKRRLHQIICPTRERVLEFHRRHWLVLVGPAVLVVVGTPIMLYADEPRTWLLLFAGATTLVDRWRQRWSSGRTALAAALWLVPFWVTLGVPTPLFRAGAVLVLALHFVVVVARWSFEALVLTDTSLWKISGLLTTAAPHVPLTRILFQDVRQNVLEQVLGCGTLVFDTAGTSDDPLARFGPVHKPLKVSGAIQRQARGG